MLYSRQALVRKLKKHLDVRESLSSNGGSSNHTSNSNHSKASVLQLSKLILFLHLGVSGHHTEGVETVVTRCAIVVIHIGQSRECTGLNKTDPHEELSQAVRAGIVGLNDRGHSLEGERLTRNANKLGNDKPNGGQHSSPAVLELSFTEPWKPLRCTLSETTGVELLGGTRRGERHGLWTFTSNVSIGKGTNSGVYRLVPRGPQRQRVRCDRPRVSHSVRLLAHTPHLSVIIICTKHRRRS